MKRLNFFLVKLQWPISFFIKLLFLFRLLRVKTIILLLKHFFRRSLGKVSPLAAMLSVTSRCQFRCRHCAVANRRHSLSEQELSTEDFKNISNQIFRLAIPRVYFDGGEPLLRPDIFEIIRHFSNKGFISFLESNGYLLSDENVKRLKESGVSCVNISLHSDSKQEHDKFTGVEGSFDKVLSAIVSCKRYKLFCILSIVATDSLFYSSSLIKIIDLARKNLVDAIRITTPHSVGRWRGNKNLLGTEAKMFIEKLFSIFPPVFKKTNIKKCVIGNTFYLDQYGRIYPCEFIPYFFGNIKNRPLLNILNFMRNHDMFSKSSSCRIDKGEFRSFYIDNFKEEEFPKQVIR